MTWDDDAACRGKWQASDGSHLFYPHDSKSPNIEEAQQVCSVCPVIEECRQAGKRERLGIWAGEVLGTVLRAGVPKVRVCGMCRREYKPKKGGQLYCGPRCAQDAINARQRARYAGALEDHRMNRRTG